MNRVATNEMNKNWFSKNSQLIGICILFLCITIYFSFFGIQKGTDDEWFKRVSEQKHFFDYIIHRYVGWSARIFPDAIMYFIFSMPLIVYSSITSASLLIAAYSIARIIKKTVNLFDIIIILAFFGWMNFPVIYHSFLWITGAVNYLWPLSLGLFSMIPYADYVFRGERWTKKNWVSLSLFVTLLFSISNEQYLLVGFCAAACAHIALVINKKKQSLFLLAKTVLMCCGLIFMYIAPGNSVRFSSEVKKWYPDFQEVSMFSHVRVGINFLFTGIYNNTFSILLLLILLAMLLLKVNKQMYIMIGLLIGLLSLMYLLPNFSGTFIQIYNLEVRQFFTLHGFSLVIKNYLIFSIFFAILGILVYRVSSYKIFSLLCILAAVLSLVMLWFSPTLFASGNRVFACANILFIIIGFDLFSKAIEKINIPRNVALALFSIYPIINLGLPLFIGLPK